MVLDLKLPDMSGFECSREAWRREAAGDVPVVVFTGRELSAGGRRAAAHHGALHRREEASNPERLLDETALFLHRVVDDLPEKQTMLEQLHSIRMKIIGGRPRTAGRMTMPQHLRALQACWSGAACVC